MSNAATTTSTTSITSITDEQIDCLLLEAIYANDHEQEALCRRALGGDVAARQACLEAIQAAEAMAD